VLIKHFYHHAIFRAIVKCRIARSLSPTFSLFSQGVFPQKEKRVEIFPERKLKSGISSSFENHLLFERITMTDYFSQSQGWTSLFTLSNSL
jgi:hypothetical protein